jgi:hypothetical protein
MHIDGNVFSEVSANFMSRITKNHAVITKNHNVKVILVVRTK